MYVIIFSVIANFPLIFNVQMQTTLRAVGAFSMTEASYELFVKAHAEGKLVKPEECGHVIAALALRAPKSFSGQFVSWDSAECAPFRKE
jgi:hypothetical protein